jgi:signal transduction histidine kinase
VRRLTFRTRLTLLWGGLFLAAGAILLGLTYLLVKERLFGTGFTFATNDPGVLAGSGGAPSRALPSSGGPSGTVARIPADTLEVIRRDQERFQRATLTTLLTQGAIALGVVTLVGMAFGWLMAERALRPLQRITEAARRVADVNLAGVNLHERIALSGPSDEIKDLADTFDSMLERLDRAFDGQRRFVGNASHELRTPLAINRTLIEVALGRPNAPPEMRLLGDTLLAVNERQERLLDGLLTLARSEQGLTARDPVDLADVAAHVLEPRLAPARAVGSAAVGSAAVGSPAVGSPAVGSPAVDAPAVDGVRLRRDLRAAPTAGDPVLLERVVQNLVQNALAYNVDDGWVAVGTRTDGDTVELTVTNTGPVVPPYEVPTLFEPFRRLHDRTGSANGTGLGLSIVRSVTGAHGGTVVAVPRDGGGLVVRVRLPVRAGC